MCAEVNRTEPSHYSSATRRLSIVELTLVAEKMAKRRSITGHWTPCQTPPDSLHLNLQPIRFIHWAVIYCQLCGLLLHQIMLPITNMMRYERQVFQRHSPQLKNLTNGYYTVDFC